VLSDAVWWIIRLICILKNRLFLRMSSLRLVDLFECRKKWESLSKYFSAFAPSDEEVLSKEKNDRTFNEALTVRMHILWQFSKLTIQVTETVKIKDRFIWFLASNERCRIVCDQLARRKIWQRGNNWLYRK